MPEQVIPVGMGGEPGDHRNAEPVQVIRELVQLGTVDAGINQDQPILPAHHDAIGPDPRTLPDPDALGHLSQHRFTVSGISPPGRKRRARSHSLRVTGASRWRWAFANGSIETSVMSRRAARGQPEQREPRDERPGRGQSAGERDDCRRGDDQRQVVGQDHPRDVRIEVCNRVTISGSASTTIDASANASATASRTVAFWQTRPGNRPGRRVLVGIPWRIDPPDTAGWSVINPPRVLDRAGRGLAGGWGSIETGRSRRAGLNEPAHAPLGQTAE